jgi:hypothetical protein
MLFERRSLGIAARCGNPRKLETSRNPMEQLIECGPHTQRYGFAAHWKGQLNDRS